MLEILKTNDQITKARAELVQRRLSTLDNQFQSWLRRFRLRRAPQIGDMVKSWDVLKTIQFIEKALPRNAHILDIGAYASEIPVALHRAGFTDLTAIDLNPGVMQMPFAGEIDYRIGDFMNTPYADASMDAVTAISVIEHGFDGERLAREVGRLLRPGGVFIASFDFWPEKIDTSGTKFFGMDWLIFSREDVLAFCETARAYQLEPVGDLDFTSGDRVIDCARKNYTFGWLVMQRKAAAPST
jgi:SAM-dependent methyltransferase